MTEMSELATLINSLYDTLAQVLVPIIKVLVGLVS